jgi:hypothetical protein
MQSGKGKQQKRLKCIFDSRCMGGVLIGIDSVVKLARIELIASAQASVLFLGVCLVDTYNSKYICG